VEEAYAFGIVLVVFFVLKDHMLQHEASKSSVLALERCDNG
jgi:hypothetical protein